MIFLDLDECLVYATPWFDPKSKGIKQIKFEDGVVYAAQKRPLADRLIKFCRSLDHTRILTMGMRDYALKINERLKLGFEFEDVVAREDYVLQRLSAWLPKKKNQHPGSILVDNQEPWQELALVKMGYLGIKEDRYIQIREFRGEDPECFEKELEEIECKIKNLKS